MLKESSLPQKVTTTWMLGFALLFLIELLLESVLFPFLGLEQTPRNDIYFQVWWVVVILWLLFGRIIVSTFISSRESQRTQSPSYQMLKSRKEVITDFKNSFEPSTEYCLSDVQLTVIDKRTGRFSALTHGPPDARVCVRAWFSNEAQGGLGEAVKENILIGERVQLEVRLEKSGEIELACIRIESELFETKHTLHVHLR